MKSFVVGRVGELAEGERRVISCDGAEIGVFNVDGELVAWYNQCARCRRRADVPGAADAGCADTAGRLSRPVPRLHAAQLPEGPAGARDRLVRKIPAADAVAAPAMLRRKAEHC